MTGKQLQVYGARIRLAWFRKAEELGSVVAACRYYGIPRSEYYYWYKRLTTNSHSKTELQTFLVEDCLDYNFYRPHSMLRMLTPVEYLQSLDGFADATLDTSVLYV
jgi:hypothetical protein